MASKSKKAIVIKKIKNIIDEWGSFDVGEVEADCSPCVSSVGKLTVLAERFGDDVDVVTYDKDGNEVDFNSLEYKELKLDVLEEILELAEHYAVDMSKTMKRCES